MVRDWNNQYRTAARPPRQRGSKLCLTTVTRSSCVDGAQTEGPASMKIPAWRSWAWICTIREFAVRQGAQRDHQRLPDRDQSGPIHRRVRRADARPHSSRGEHSERVGSPPPGVARPRGDRRRPQLRADGRQSIAPNNDRSTRSAHRDGRVRDRRLTSGVSPLGGTAPCADRARGAGCAVRTRTRYIAVRGVRPAQRTDRRGRCTHRVRRAGEPPVANSRLSRCRLLSGARPAEIHHLAPTSAEPDHLEAEVASY